jgi:hypothetical protein
MNSDWLNPAMLAKLVIGYATVHAISGLGIIVFFPSSSFIETVARLREVAASSFMLMAIGALVLSISRSVDILWNDILPQIRRD